MTSPYQPLKVYLAAPFEDREEMLALKAALEARNCKVTSTWLTPADGNDNNMATLENKFQECRTRAVKDVEDVAAADILVLRKPKDKHKVPTTGGHHNETGICIGSGKPFIVYGARENVFHYHPLCVAVVETFEELCDYLHIPREARMTIKELMDRARANSVAHGFGDNDIWQHLGNLHSEVSEAWEAARMPDFDPTKVLFHPDKPTKPDGFPAELADIMIRCADTAAKFGVDLEQAILQKMAYNETRPRRHGGKRA